MNEDSAADPTVEPYQPFPPFRVFMEHEPDLTAYESAADQLTDLRTRVDPMALQRAVDTATRWAAIDTGAIEGLYTVERGFTMTIAASAAALDNAHLEVGQEAARYIQDAIAGYEFVLDVATSSREPTENWIKELHAVLCASQDTYRVWTESGSEERPLPKGEYKEFPNSPFNFDKGTVHSYAQPFETAAEMSRLIQELRSPQFNAAHPVLQAAYAHYAFVCIHPFADGNGRVARALASTYLYRSPGVPLVVFADQKGEYIAALELADSGEFPPLLTFIRDRAVDTVFMVSADMQRPDRPEVSERVEYLNTMMRSGTGLLHSEIDALVARVRTTWMEALQRAISGLVEPISASHGLVSIQRPPLDGYRVPEATAFQLTLTSSPPASAQAQTDFVVQVAKPGTPGPDFVVVATPFRFDGTYGESTKLLQVFLRDVHPTVNPALTYRLDIAAEDVIRTMVDQVVELGVQSLRAAGYI